MADHRPPSEKPAPQTARDVELIKVIVTRDGTKVSAQWAIHPQMKVDLLPQEWQEVSDLMGRITSLIGTRFAQVLAQAEPERPGTA
jgi:hypothetical protein